MSPKQGVGARLQFGSLGGQLAVARRLAASRSGQLLKEQDRRRAILAHREEVGVVISCFVHLAGEEVRIRWGERRSMLFFSGVEADVEYGGVRLSGDGALLTVQLPLDKLKRYAVAGFFQEHLKKSKR